MRGGVGRSDFFSSPLQVKHDFAHNVERMIESGEE